MQAWLEWQETLNPRGIDLGLERCLPVADALDLLPLPFPLVTVAGTNGKGSCVALLESVLSAAGYRVGSCTSPHLLRINETIRIAGEPVSDEALMGAFEAVAAARNEVMLTWFEFRTLAAARILRDSNPDIALLEVGLGGRLDAVNMFDPDVALISSIGVDHTNWLGTSRDDIGREKAGICRPGRPAICAELDPPLGFLEEIQNAGSRLFRAGIDYRYHGSAESWKWSGPDAMLDGLPAPGIAGECQLGNAAAVLMALDVLRSRFPVSRAAIHQGISGCRLEGRQAIVSSAPELVLDVAHNPQAAEALAATLTQRPRAGKTRAVFGIYADKDIAAVARALGEHIDVWHICALSPPRGAPAKQIAAALESASIDADVVAHADVGEAFVTARGRSAAEDRIVVFGSFETVRRVIETDSPGGR